MVDVMKWSDGTNSDKFKHTKSLDVQSMQMTLLPVAFYQNQVV